MVPTDTGAFICEQHWGKWHTEKGVPHIDMGSLRVGRAKESKKEKQEKKEFKKSKKVSGC
jgi:hypothetical protein